MVCPLIFSKLLLAKNVEKQHYAPCALRYPVIEIMVVRIPIEDWIDLHTFSPKEIPSLLEEYLLECRKKGFKEVRIIHGKGTGRLRQVIRGALSQHPHVSSFEAGSDKEGGEGVTIAKLAQ